MSSRFWTLAPFQAVLAISGTIVGSDPAKIMAAFDEIMRTGGKSGLIPELWDGHAATRIAETINAWLTNGAVLHE